VNLSAYSDRIEVSGLSLPNQPVFTGVILFPGGEVKAKFEFFRYNKGVKKGLGGISWALKAERTSRNPSRTRPRRRRPRRNRF
jgi:hypothetical protein